MMMRFLSSLLLLTVTCCHASLLTPFLTNPTSPYDDLLNCMWNGTDVGKCHSLACIWCHSVFSDICVTTEYASHLDGSVFSCESHTDDDDDHAAVDDDDAALDDAIDVDDDAIIDDDDAAPAPITAAPITPVPTVTPTSSDVEPITDDDPNHDANADYFHRLLECEKNGVEKKCNSAEDCVWCTYAPVAGICLSHQAAKQMGAGGYYTCPDDDEDEEEESR